MATIANAFLGDNPGLTALSPGMIGLYNLFADEIHPQITVAYHFVQQLKANLDAQFGAGNYELAFTGHSLGGLIASVMAQIEGVQAVVMNPVPATAYNIGAMHNNNFGVASYL